MAEEKLTLEVSSEFCIRDALDEAGPFFNGTKPTDQEVSDRLDLFGELVWRLASPTQREIACQYWDDWIADTWDMRQPRRIVRAAMEAGRNAFRAQGKDDACTKRKEPVLIEKLLADPELDKEPAWIFHGYAARGEVSLLAGRPKIGKTTFLAHLATHVSAGFGFIDRPVEQCGVLWIDLEQHLRRTARLFRKLEISGSPLYLFNGRSITFDLSAFILEHEIGLVIIDSLSKFWNIEDENDSVTVTRATDEVRLLAEHADAAIILIHHSRKSGGEDGLDIRGSGAIVAAVDVAISLKGVEKGPENRRILDAVSRDEETPRKLLVSLQDGVYRALGTVTEVKERAKRAPILEAMTDTPQQVDELAEALGLSKRTVYQIAKDLHEEGIIERRGTGIKGDAYRYFRKEVAG